MSTHFDEVVAAFDTAPGPAGPTPTPRRVAVLGAGRDGRLLAALLHAIGTVQVTVFSVYADEVSALDRGSIVLRGDGPIGSFPVAEDGVRVTGQLDAAVSDADVVVLTGPVLKLRIYAMALAPHLRDDQVVVLVGARTFGGLEARWWLRAGGHAGDVTIIDLVTLPWTVTEVDGALHLTAAAPAVVGVEPAQRTGLLDWLEDAVGPLDRRSTLLHASFADPSGTVEVPALLLGGPAVADPPPAVLPGAVPAGTSTLRALVQGGVATAITALAEERTAVAAAFGVRDLAPGSWTELVAGHDGPSGSRPMPHPEEARDLVRCGTMGSLVPLADAGGLAGVATPTTDAVVQLASVALGSELATAGRTLSGIGYRSVDDVRRAVGVGGGRGR